MRTSGAKSNVMEATENACWELSYLMRNGAYPP